MKVCPNCQNDLFTVDVDDNVVILECVDCGERIIAAEAGNMPDED